MFDYYYLFNPYIVSLPVLAWTRFSHFILKRLKMKCFIRLLVLQLLQSFKTYQSINNVLSEKFSIWNFIKNVFF